MGMLGLDPPAPAGRSEFSSASLGLTLAAGWRAQSHAQAAHLRGLPEARVSALLAHTEYWSFCTGGGQLCNGEVLLADMDMRSLSAIRFCCQQHGLKQDWAHRFANG